MTKGETENYSTIGCRGIKKWLVKTYNFIQERLEMTILESLSIYELVKFNSMVELKREGIKPS